MTQRIRSRLALLAAATALISTVAAASLREPLTAFAASAGEPQQKKWTDPDFDEQAPAGLVLGRVVDAVTNRPIARAAVAPVGDTAASPRDTQGTPTAVLFGQTPRVLTDSDGRFVFRNLAAGTYLFPASAPGYLDGGFGQRRPGGPMQRFALADGGRAGDVTIRLWPEATIGGIVTDETTSPLGGVRVSLVAREAMSRTAPGAMRSTAALTATTDDRGVYRFTGIAPGEYIVAVASRLAQAPFEFATAPGTPAAGVRLGNVLLLSPEQIGNANNLSGMLPTTIDADGRVTSYATTFYPGTTRLADATPIAVKPGDDRAGVDLQLRPARLVQISGTAIDTSGPVANIALHLFHRFAVNGILERTFETAMTTTDASGRFTFLGVPPGDFVIKVWRFQQALVIGQTPLPSETTLWTEQPIAVGPAGVRDLTVPLSAGLTIAGRIQFDGAAQKPNALTLQTPISVAFEPEWPMAFGARMATRVTPAFEFVTQQLPPGRYFAVLPNNFTPRGWYFESAIHQGKDLLVTPLVLDAQPVTDVVVTFSDRRSELSGAVRDAAGRPDAAASVVIFPADYRAWIQAGANPLAARVEPVSQTGAYAIQLRPGDYLVAAVRDEALAQWPQVAAVDAIAARATRVTIARGDVKQLDLVRR